MHEMAEETNRSLKDDREDRYDRTILIICGGKVSNGVVEAVATRNFFESEFPKVLEGYDDVILEPDSQTTQENIVNAMRIILRQKVRPRKVTGLFPRGQVEKGAGMWFAMKARPECQGMRITVTASNRHRTFDGEAGEEAIVIEPGPFSRRFRRFWEAPVGSREEAEARVLARLEGLNEPINPQI